MLAFFFNDTSTTEIYTLSLHDALPILLGRTNDLLGRTNDLLGRTNHLLGRTNHLLGRVFLFLGAVFLFLGAVFLFLGRDRKSTRLNSSHANISYAVFCLKKKNISYARN